MTTNAPETTSVMHAESPGSMLRAARSAQGLTQEVVSQKLHLAVRQIAALEEDDFAQLPGPTYVRGYLRSYALLVGLLPENVIGAYNQRVPQKTYVAAPVTEVPAPAKEVTSTHATVRWTTYLVIGGIAALVIGWWQGRGTPPKAPAVAERAAPATGAVATGDAAPTILANVPAVAPAAPTAPTPLMAQKLDPRQPVSLGPTPAPAPAAKPGVAPPPAPAAPAVAKPPVAPATPVPAAALPAAAPKPAEKEPAGVRARVIVYTDQETWADIRDARQNKLLYETIPAGRVVTLEGTVPLSLFFGNASGVRIEYNGQPFDISKHRRGMVARFTLGEASTAQ